MKRFLALAVLVAAVFTAAFAPLQAFAQEAAPAATAAVDHSFGGEVSKAFIQVVLPVLATGIASILTIALAALAKWLQTKSKGNKLFEVAARATHFAEVVVHELEATIRAELLEATKDGELTEEEKQRIKNAAIARMKALLGSTGLEELQAVLGIGAGQLDTYLGGLIEKAVASMPSTTGSEILTARATTGEATATVAAVPQ